MAFLHHNIGDPRLVVFFQFDAGISNGKQLIVKNLAQGREREDPRPFLVHHRTKNITTCIRLYAHKLSKLMLKN